MKGKIHLINYKLIYEFSLIYYSKDIKAYNHENMMENKQNDEN